MGLRRTMMSVNRTIKSAAFFTMAAQKAETLKNVKLISAGLILATNVVSLANNLVRKGKRRKSGSRNSGSNRGNTATGNSDAIPNMNESKVDRHGFRDVGLDDAYDVGVKAPMEDTPTEPSKPKAAPIKESDKLQAIDPETEEMLERLRAEGIIDDDGTDSMLDGLYDGNVHFKEYFCKRKFKDGFRTHWKEVGYELTIVFPTQDNTRLLVKEDGVYSADGKKYYVHGGTGAYGDKTLALMNMLNDFPVTHADVLVDVMYGYEVMMDKELIDKDVV